MGQLVIMVWGPEDLFGPRAPGLAGSVPILGQRFPQYELVLIALGPLVLGALHLLFRRTRWGILVMNRGELIAQGTPAAVAADPLVREVYFGGGGG